MGKLGFYEGKHYSAYKEKVERLIAAGDEEQAEGLLLKLVSAIEAESSDAGWDVPAWYYEQLAMIYREQKEYAAEVAILERFAKRQHSSGGSTHRLGHRLSEASRLLQASQAQTREQ